ncbi:tyrosine-type recombinase/integrase [Roseococcus sp.]|uniref:tyrosine-type recombinase/integrase n=1 Tax=Roseococcus sp. TaxID=2109646 RepID=UPI003BAA0CEC
MRRQRERARLTKRLVDAFSCPPNRKDALLFDGDVTGFALRATASGSKLFLLQYKHGGTVRRLPLGEYGVITVDQARTLAQEARGRVSAGGDPLAERRSATHAAVQERKLERDTAKAEAFTFKAMVERWRKEHLAPKRSPGYAAEAERALLVSFAKWSDRAAQSITSAEASDALDKIREERGPAAASHAFRYAHAAFNWAERRELVFSNPMARAVAPEKSKARDRALTDAELGTVWRATEKLAPPFGAMFHLLILTLQRRSEVAGMRWSEISEDGQLWTLPSARTKNAQRHIVHLSPTAQAVIKAIPRFQKSDLVFTTTGKTPVSGFSRAKQRVDEYAAEERRKMKIKPAEIPAWHVHDLRRTGVSTMARLGIPSDVADRILNHQASSTNSGVKGIYQVHSFGAEREEALRSWAKHIATVGALLVQPKLRNRQ